MSPEEMSRYIQFLFEQIQQKDVQHKELLEQISEIKGELKQTNSEQKRFNDLVLYLTNQLNETLHNLQELQRENENLKAPARISKKTSFGQSQSGRHNEN